MSARDPSGGRPHGFAAGAFIAEFGQVVPGERGEPAGGQLLVTALRQVVEVLDEPGDAAHEPVEVDAVTAHQGVGALEQ